MGWDTTPLPKVGDGGVYFKSLVIRHAVPSPAYVKGLLTEAEEGGDRRSQELSG